MGLKNKHILPPFGSFLGVSSIGFDWSGLVMGFNADNNANDVLGVINGTLTNGATANGTGIINQGFVFDAVNDFISLPLSCWQPVGDFSISLWVNYQSNTGSNSLVDFTNYTSGSGQTRGWRFGIFNDFLKFQVYNANVVNEVGFDFNTGYGWKHIVVSRVGSTSTKLYINNNLEQNSSYTMNPNYHANTYNSIGVNRYTLGGTSYQYYNKHTLDSIYMFNRALSAVEVSQLYNSGTGLQY